MAASSTAVYELMQTAHGLGLDAQLAKIVKRLTPITGWNDPQRMRKLGELDPAIEQALVTKLVDLVLSVP